MNENSIKKQDNNTSKELDKPEEYNNVDLYENYIYDYMNNISIFKKYSYYNIELLNKQAENDNNILKYEFNYKVSQILITYQKKLGNEKDKYTSLNSNIFNNEIKKYLLPNDKKNNTIISYDNDFKYRILTTGFIEIYTINTNDIKINKNIYVFKLIKYAYLGFKFFNNLKKIFPTLGYIYCYIKCPYFYINIKDINFKNWCEKSDRNEDLRPYVITDSYLVYTNYYNMSLLNLFAMRIKEFLLEIIELKPIKEEEVLYIILQFISIINYINKYILKDADKNDKELILNFKFVEFYTIKIKDDEEKYKIPIFNKDGKNIGYIKTKFILYIPIISNYDTKITIGGFVEIINSYNYDIINVFFNSYNIKLYDNIDYDNIKLYEDYIYNYMNITPVFEKYLIFNIQNLNDIAKKNNNIKRYNFNYQVSQILITYQKDLSYGNRPSILDNLNIFKNIKQKFINNDYNKKYNLNTNSLKYFLSSKKIDDEKEEYFTFYNYKILNFGFIDVITTNNNNLNINYELIKNAYLGFKFFNDLKKYFPTFLYTYCYMKCTKIDDDNFKNKNWCDKTDNTNELVPYVITENIIYNTYKELEDIVDIIDEYQNTGDDKNKIKQSLKIIQLVSIINYIKIHILNHVNENDKNLILDFKINNIYFKKFDDDIRIPFYPENSNNKDNSILTFKTNIIIYIPIISYNKMKNNKKKYKIRDIINIFNRNNLNNLLNDLLYNNNEIENNINQNIYEPFTLNFLNKDKVLNNYNYNLILNENINDLFEDKKNTFTKFHRLFINDNNDNNNINSDTIDIKLKKFVSEYCLNDLKYMQKNSSKSAKKEVLEKAFNILIDNKIKKLTEKIKKNYDVIIIYNKYVNFIDTLVKAKCLNYKVKLYDIFKLKINLAKKIIESGFENEKKDNMIYTIEESYKNLPNSNFFLNFISKTPLVDIIINAFIFYLSIYSIFYLYYFIQNNPMEIIEKSILKNYITLKNLGEITKALEYGIKFASDLFNNYNSNVIVSYYHKLYQNGFINISYLFNKFIFILPELLGILMNAYTKYILSGIFIIFFNDIIEGINKKIFKNKFLRFRIKNLLSANFPSMIYFIWKEVEVNNSNEP